MGLLFLMLQLDSAPTSTTVVASASTMSATASMSSSTVTTTPASTATTGTTTPARPVFESSIGLIDPVEVSSSRHEGCPLDVESLRAVDVSHFGYDGEVHTGRLVVAEEVAEDMVAIMSRLFEAGFPISGWNPWMPMRETTT